ncbi:MAG: pabB, partial [Nocardioidaceae bacterium]|nr:pabB [Nocardioidaceae bacterium]
MRPERMFWLDGGGSREWSGRRSLVGLLRDDDVSLTFDATRREVLRHRSGRSEPVGDDVFAVLAAELGRDAGDPDVHWVGYLGYACRTDLPVRPGNDGVPDAVWMRVRRPRFVTHPAVPV